MEKTQTKVIVLAGGQGKRMGTEMPKVLVLLNGKPLIRYVCEGIRASGISSKPIVVIGKGGEAVRDELKNTCEYVRQSEQLGTGHAVMVCEDAVRGTCEHIIVLYGDMPFVSSREITRLRLTHLASRADLTLMTVEVADFSGWKSAFMRYGRIVRNNAGEIEKIVEYRDANDKEKNILEVNPSFFCFRASWLWENIHKLKNINAQKEYYLTDMLGIARKAQARIASVSVDPVCAFGVNTKEDLRNAKDLLAGTTTS